MMRAMFAAISGLKSHQTMLDVTANNIANVNTVGYKRNQINFANVVTGQSVKGRYSAGLYEMDVQLAEAGAPFFPFTSPETV